MNTYVLNKISSNVLVNILDIKVTLPSQVIEGIVTIDNKMMVDVSYAINARTLHSHEIATEYLPVVLY